MKVLLFIKYLGGRVGGTERNVCQIANYLSRNGNDVTIATYEENSSLPAFEVDKKVRIYNMHIDETLKNQPSKEEVKKEENFQTKYNSKEAIEWLAKSRSMRLHWERGIRKIEPDVILSFIPHTSTPLLFQLADCYKIIVTNQNNPNIDYLSDKHGTCLFDKKLRIELLEKAYKVHVLIPDYKNFFPKSIQDRVVVIPNASIEPRIVSCSKREIYMKKSITCIGRLEPQKGHNILIEAMDHVINRNPDWKLFIYGRGPEEENLRRLIRKKWLQKNVLIMGNTGNPVRELQYSEIFVIPSVYEGWGLTLSEAMSVGKACIGFKDCTGVNFLIDDQINGLLVSKRFPIDLANSINKLIEDPKFSNELGVAAKKKMELFRPEKVLCEWIKIIS
jgi:glycosyltransferase involved in cell wall biosynthesis